MKLWGYILALVLVAGYGLEAFHYLLVPHELCSLHGELVHSSHDHTHKKTAKAAKNPKAVVGKATDDSDSAEPDCASEGHCLVSSLRRTGVVSAPVTVTTVLPHFEAPRIAKPVLRFSFVEATYQFAPKTSPPKSLHS